MAKRGKYHRKRRGRFSFLYKILTFLVICGVIAVALTFFFKVQDRQVTGNAHYTGQEIVEASGVEIGDNLFLMNKVDISQRITSTLPYVESVQIRRVLPDTLSFHVTECTAPAVIVQDGQAWLISNSGKIVDCLDAQRAENYAMITGLTVEPSAIGQYISASQEQKVPFDTVLTLLPLLSDKELLDDIKEIHLEDAAQIRLQYQDRFAVLLPWDTDMNYKLNYLIAVIEKLENNETGTIDMMQEGRASFIPD